MATEDQLGIVPFKRLTSFKVDQVAKALSRHGEMVYQESVGLRLDEARMLGAVLSWQPIALKDLCQALSLSKSHCSRLVANMVGLGLLDRHEDPLDQRSFYLSVTAHGFSVLKTVNDLALARDRQLCELLDDEERLVLDRALDKLHVQVSRMQEERLPAGEEPGVARGLAVGVDELQTSPVMLIERQKVEKLVDQLQNLLRDVASPAK